MSKIFNSETSIKCSWKKRYSIPAAIPITKILILILFRYLLRLADGLLTKKFICHIYLVNIGGVRSDCEGNSRRSSIVAESGGIAIPQHKSKYKNSRIEYLLTDSSERCPDFEGPMFFLFLKKIVIQYSISFAYYHFLEPRPLSIFLFKCTL